MSEVRTVQKFTPEALKASQQMPKETYKQIKHMSKVELTDYFNRCWMDGFKKGRDAGIREAKAKFNEAGIARAKAAKRAESEG